MIYLLFLSTSFSKTGSHFSGYALADYLSCFRWKYSNHVLLPVTALS
ncbi:hypothetical protein CEV32_4206 [Brucella rhizosphaerae]|uniref:Uncharacterized protein n=1 Tax=Brucella rhizosphaerae TaxID=571254 RepID=A0A256FP02_9HYPH|nr:hypothetical protein CEV32_4206 [Brucella rhizosphaerae]